jgi:hypothetical protein
MQISLSHLVALCLGVSHLTHALVTLQTIRNLTQATDESRERIVESGAVGDTEGVVEIDEMARVLGGVGVGGGQAVLGRDGEEGEVEDVSFLFFSGALEEDQRYMDSCLCLCGLWVWCWVGENREDIECRVLLPWWGLWECWKIRLMDREFRCVSEEFRANNNSDSRRCVENAMFRSVNRARETAFLALTRSTRGPCPSFYGDQIFPMNPCSSTNFHSRKNAQV